MPHLDSFSRDYLRLVLEIHTHHIDGYVDSYYGPEAIKTEIESSPPQNPVDLLAQITDLRSRIPDADPNRHTYLTAALRGVDCTVRMLNGETFDFLDEVYRIYDILPELIDESRFETARRELDMTLPVNAAGENIGARLQGWRKTFEIGAEHSLPLLDLARLETRRRTVSLVELPEDEGVEIALVSGQPWGAYNWYLGRGRSLIEFNTDMPLQATGLIGTFAHEGYPGHHTEHLLKEKSLYREKSYAEQSAMLLHTPAAVIAEGIATTALEMIFPNGSHHDWNAGVLFPQAGIDLSPDLVATMCAIGRASSDLRYVTGNAAILYHTSQINREQAIDYIQTYGLVTPDRAAKSFSFIDHPLYRSYIFTYTVGYDLIKNTADPRGTFLHLLTSQVLPSQLVAGN